MCVLGQFGGDRLEGTIENVIKVFIKKHQKLWYRHVLNTSFKVITLAYTADFRMYLLSVGCWHGCTAPTAPTEAPLVVPLFVKAYLMQFHCSTGEREQTTAETVWVAAGIENIHFTQMG